MLLCFNDKTLTLDIISLLSLVGLQKMTYIIPLSELIIVRYHKK